MAVGGSIPFVMWSSFADEQPWFESTSSVVENRICACVAEWLGNGLQIRLMLVRIQSCTPSYPKQG